MSDEESGETQLQFFIKDEQKWLEVEKYKANVEKYKTEKYVELLNKGLEAFKEYATRTKRNITIGVFVLITLIFFSMATLTYFGKVGGETFAFVTGTIIGYIISVLKQ
jgi:hypothetical protein